MKQYFVQEFILIFLLKEKKKKRNYKRAKANFFMQHTITRRGSVKLSTYAPHT